MNCAGSHDAGPPVAMRQETAGASCSTVPTVVLTDALLPTPRKSQPIGQNRWACARNGRGLPGHGRHHASTGWSCLYCTALPRIVRWTRVRCALIAPCGRPGIPLREFLVCDRFRYRFARTVPCPTTPHPPHASRRSRSCCPTCSGTWINSTRPCWASNGNSGNSNASLSRWTTACSDLLPVTTTSIPCRTNRPIIDPLDREGGRRFMSSTDSTAAIAPRPSPVSYRHPPCARGRPRRTTASRCPVQ